MNGAGFSPLLAYDPQDYVKWQQLQRRQALAQALLEKGMGETSNRPYSGLVSAGNQLLGAYLLKKSDQDTAAMFGGGDQTPGPSPDPGQISNMPTPPVKTADAAAGPPQAAPQAAPPSPNQGMAPQPPMQSPAPPQAPQGQGAPINPHIAAIYNNPTFPKIPGVDPGTAVMAMMQGGQAWSDYMKAYYAAVGPTEAWRTAMQATGGDEVKSRAYLQGKMDKDAIVSLRAGNVGINMATGQSFAVPNASGVVAVPLPGGGYGQAMAPGAAQAQAQSAAAQAIGGAIAKPGQLYDPISGTYPLGNQATAAGISPQVQAGLGLGGGQPSSPTLMQAPPLGAKEFVTPVAGAAGQGQADLRTMASDVPTRLNVLQNILNLSRVAQTGSPEWIQDARNAAAGLQQALGHPVNPNDQAALLGEIKKYMSQYGLRMAAGQPGTATDRMREEIETANPHSEMFPATLQRIVPWIMANEHAIAGKANAQDQWFAPGTGHPLTQQNQAAFENRWRNAMDPRVYQLQMMNPQQQQQYIRSLPPSEAKAILEKRQALRALGGLQ